METRNDQLVGVSGGGIVVAMPKQKMIKEEALRHAAWLVALAEEHEGEFEKILIAVQNTWHQILCHRPDGPWTGKIQARLPELKAQ